MPDEGSPISYEVLEHDTPVRSADGIIVGRVERVRADVAADIFDGLDIHTQAGLRFVEAERVAAIHEHGVDLDLDSGAIADLPAPDRDAPEYTADPTARRTLLSRIAGRRGGWRRSG